MKINKLDKEKIALNFSSASASYDEFAQFQIETAKKLARKLSDLEGRVLDVGSGTGFLTEELLTITSKDKNKKNLKIFATDISLAMLLQTQKKFKASKTLNLSSKNLLLVSDFEALPYKENTFNAIVSNLSYQWASDLQLAFSEALRTLNPGGSVNFTTLGSNSLNELRSSIKSTFTDNEKTQSKKLLEFHTSKEIKAQLKNAGFSEILIEIKKEERIYQNIFSLLKSLKKNRSHQPKPLQDR